MVKVNGACNGVDEGEAEGESVGVGEEVSALLESNVKNSESTMKTVVKNNFIILIFKD
jgi:hypothetical protein